MHKKGVREDHPITGLGISAQCTNTPRVGSDFCDMHGGEKADSDSESARDAVEPVSSRTRLRVDIANGVPPLQKEVVTSAEGCEKTYFHRKGHTVGILVVTRPCGVVVHMQELVPAEGTHEVLQALYDLHQLGVYDLCIVVAKNPFSQGLDLKLASMTMLAIWIKPTRLG